MRRAHFPNLRKKMTRNMFGTLEICLPSEHVGGGVRLIHGQDEKVLETHKSSSYGVSYLAWYNDVSHEVLPVQAGYRVVLTYNLVNNSTELQLSAAVQDVEQSRIKQMLNKWYSMPNRPALMCYALQHEYTSAKLQFRLPKLRLSSLKGDDYYRCCQLDSACRSNGRFCVFLSTLERHVNVTGSKDEDYEEVEESSCLRDIVTLHGDKLQNTSMQTDCLARGYEHSQLVKQWAVGRLDDEPSQSERVYHDTVAIIVPRVSAAESLLGRGYTASDYSELLRRLCDILENSHDDYEHDLFREMIVQTCRRHIKRQYNNNQMKDALMGQTAIASLRIGKSELARAALDSVKHTFDASTFQELGRLGYEDTRDFCVEAFSRIPNLHLVDRGLRAFQSGVASDTPRPQSSMESEHQWAVEVLCNVLSSITTVSPEDAGAVVQLLDSYRDEAVWKLIDCFVRRFLDEEGFTTTLLVEVLCHAQTVQKTDLMEHLLPAILHPAVSSFQLQQFSSRRKHDSCSSEDYPFSSWPQYDWLDQTGEQDAAVVMSLYRHLAKDSLNIAGQLLTKIANDIATIHDDDLNTFIIPLLREMIDITILQPAEASRFYFEAISTYIKRKVGRGPPKRRRWQLQWQIKAHQAQSSLRSLPETQLRQCLGDARYLDLMELRNVRVQSKEEPIPSGMEGKPTQLSGPVARERKRE